jgi:hypothetical protein
LGEEKGREMQEIQDKQYKSVEKIEENVQEIREELAPIISEYKGLVDSKYYSGGLEANVENYIPDGLELTESELVSLRNGVRRLGTGLRCSIPVNCYGDSCPFKAQCPLHKIGKAPVGKSCPIEEMLMDTYTKRYIDEFDVTAEHMSEVTTMTMLAATHIMEMRAFMVLGRDDEDNPDGFIKNVVGFNNEDQPIESIVEHPAYNQIERAWRWRRNLLESLVGTRKEKYKQMAALKERTAESPSTAAADLKAKIDKLSVVDVSEV